MSQYHREEWKKKLVTPGDVLQYIKPGMNIFIGSGMAEPRTLVKSLVESGLSDANDLEVIQLTTHSDFVSLKELDYRKYRLKTFFSTWVSSEAVVAGSVDLIPA